MPPRTARVLTVLLATLAPLAALGHALLVESSPKEGETLTPAAATQATLRFNARLEKKVSRVNLVDADGVTLKLPPQKEDKDPDRLVIPLPANLKPGGYYIEYRVMATDGHSTPGLVRFTIAPATAPSTTRPRETGK